MMVFMLCCDVLNVNIKELHDIKYMNLSYSLPKGLFATCNNYEIPRGTATLCL